MVVILSRAAAPFVILSREATKGSLSRQGSFAGSPATAPAWKEIGSSLALLKAGSFVRSASSG